MDDMTRAVITILLLVFAVSPLIWVLIQSKKGSQDPNKCCEGCGIKNGNLFYDSEVKAKIGLVSIKKDQTRSWCQNCEKSYFICERANV